MTVNSRSRFLSERKVKSSGELSHLQWGSVPSVTSLSSNTVSETYTYSPGLNKTTEHTRGLMGCTEQSMSVSEMQAVGLLNSVLPQSSETHCDPVENLWLV